MKIGNVSVGDKPRTAVIVSDKTTDDQLGKLKEAGVDFLELRVDKCEKIDSNSLIKLINRFKKFNFPIIATIRMPEEGGDKFIDDRKREKIFTDILAHVDAIDIELQSYDLIENMLEAIHEKDKILIGSYHNFKRTPDYIELNDIISDGKDWGCDIIKIAVKTKSNDDMINLLKITLERVNEGLISIAIGAEGKASRVFFPFVGSLITYGFIDEAAAPGQIDIFTLIKQINFYTDKE